MEGSSNIWHSAPAAGTPDGGQAPPPAEVALNPNIGEQERLLLHALLQATDYGVLVSDLERQDILANRRLGELFDLDPHGVVQMTPREVLTLARGRIHDPEAFERRIAEICEDPWLRCEDEIRTTSSPPRVVRRSTGPILGPHGRPIGRLWTFLDVTQTRRLQAQVADQLQARSAELAETSRVLEVMNALCRLSLDDRTEPALLDEMAALLNGLLGLRRAAIMLFGETGGFSRCSGDVGAVAALEAAPAYQDILTSWKTGGVRRPAALYGAAGEALVLAPLCVDGRLGGLVAWEAESDPHLDPHREAHVAAVVDQMQSTLDARRLREELHAAQERLVNVAKLRTAGLLSAVVAHDIRNILTPLQLELARGKDAVSEAVRVQAARLSALTHQLLSIAAPEALDLQPLALPDLVRRVTPLVERQAAACEVRLIADLPESLPPVRADADQLEHLLVNLCLNGIEAMAGCGGTLTLRATAAGGYLELTVEDTGPGVPEERRERLFEPFYTTKRRGVGLGLFSCRRIAQDHGGSLTLEQGEARGARFRLRLPR